MSFSIVLISGIPGAGKTTIADKLSKKLPKSAVISGDILRNMIVGGHASPANPWNEETHKQYYLSFKHGALLAESFINEGYKVILDDTLHAGNLYDEWATYFEKFKPLKVLLKPNIQSALQRNADRKTHNVDESVMREVYDNFIKYDYSDWFIYDNSYTSIEETVDVIKNKLDW